jgi:hypothetical protein
VNIDRVGFALNVRAMSQPLIRGFVRLDDMIMRKVGSRLFMICSLCELPGGGYSDNLSERGMGIPRSVRILRAVALVNRRRMSITVLTVASLVPSEKRSHPVMTEG